VGELLGMSPYTVIRRLRSRQLKGFRFGEVWRVRDRDDYLQRLVDA
jgi:hypothetical protein